VNKKVIIMMAVAGLVSFGGAFGFAWFTRKAPLSESPAEQGSNEAAFANRATLELPEPEAGAVGVIGAGESGTKRVVSEQQLKSLVHEVRESIRRYNGKLQDLESWEQRLRMAQDTLKEDIENLNNLQVELASMTAALKSEREKLLQTRVEIAAAEKANLMSLAAAYDKMDASSASKILVRMCIRGEEKSSGDQSGQMHDAVKILYYMGERTKANLLTELVGSEPKLAAILCRSLKRIVEEK
jgi:DNA-binding helix-hairpin-helix protein with protein kinase domain